MSRLRARTTTLPAPRVSLLPVAAGQVPLWPAFNALNVPAMAAGSVYADPAIGTPTVKLTSATYPVANASMLNAYSAMGLQIGGPWGSPAVNYTLYVFALSGGGSLIDYNSATRTESNARSTPWGSDTRFTFSYSTSTPQIAYYMTATAHLKRYDTAAMAEAPTATFPAGGKDFSGLVVGGAQQMVAVQVDVNDRYYTFMNVAGDAIYAWDAQTDTFYSTSVARVRAIRAATDIDEPHLDHDGRYVYLKIQQLINVGGGDSRNIMVWDLQNDKLSDLAVGWSHPAPMRSMVTGINPGDFSQQQYVPAPVTVEGSASTGTRTTFATDSQVGGGESHRAGQWNQGAIGTQQYVLLSNEAPMNNRTDDLINPTWSLETGAIWKATMTYAFQQVTMGGIGDVLELNSAGTSVVSRLTKVANLAAIVSPGQWALVGTTLYVWRLDSLAPNITTRRIAAQVIAPVHDAIAYLRLDNGSTRILGHHYSWNPRSADYYAQPHVTESRDGVVAFGGSNMNVLGGRTDVFVWQAA